MPATQKKCRVCGKLYEACRTMRNATGGFRWQEVACCPECGDIYLARIIESRQEASKPKEEKAVSKKKKKDTMDKSSVKTDNKTDYDNIPDVYEDEEDFGEEEIAEYFGDTLDGE